MNIKLITKQHMAQLLKNGKQQDEANQNNESVDFKPVVKLFAPDAQCTWLLTEISPENNDTAFGLCDLGLGCPELGYVSLEELRRTKGNLGLPIERDRFFEATKTLSEYAEEARLAHHIVT